MFFLILGDLGVKQQGIILQKVKSQFAALFHSAKVSFLNHEHTRNTVANL